MKYTKLFTICIAFFLSICNCQIFVFAENNNIAKKTSSMKERYFKIITEYNSYSSLNSINVNDGLEHENEFEIIDSINFKPEITVIEQSNDDTNGEAILFDEVNKMYLYANAINNSTMELIVNGITFEAKVEENKMVLISENGEQLPVLESLDADISNDLSTENKDLIRSARASSSWVLVASYIKGQTNMYLKAVSVLSSAASAVTWACHLAGVPNLKLIEQFLTVTGIFTFAGELRTVTMYTLYDRYYKSDCTTYIKDYIRIYQYADYHGYVGSGYNYFHSVRPDYSGQNCLAYA